MIVVRVELHHATQPGKVTELARMEICNEGTSADGVFGRYSIRTLVGRCKSALDKHRVNRVGKVGNHNRRDDHVWHLVARALRSIHYGDD